MDQSKQRAITLRNALDDWHDRPLDWITRDRVAKHNTDNTTLSPTSANKVRRVLRAVFEYASGEYLDAVGNSRFRDNPVKKLSHIRIRNPESRVEPIHDRVSGADDENTVNRQLHKPIDRFWQSFDSMQFDVRFRYSDLPEIPLHTDSANYFSDH